MGLTNGIRDIPGIMEQLGWTQGRDLQLDWFRRRARAVRNAGTDSDRRLVDYSEPPNTTAVSLHWVKTFRRASNAFSACLENRFWLSSYNQRQLGRWLRNRGYLGPNERRFPDSHITDVRDLHDKWRNLEGVWVSGSVLFADGLDAALAGFFYRAGLEGTVTPIGGGRYRVSITKVAIYAHDSFDFWDPAGEDQDLGYWGTPNRFNPIWSPGLDHVTNGSYRDYRSRTGYGGDFEVLTADIEWLDRRDSFEFDPQATQPAR